MILIIVFLAGGIIYATFASNRMSFDPLIELRFFARARSGSTSKYFEHLKSMTLPLEVSYRMIREDRRA